MITLVDLVNATEQQIFDQALEHLRLQKQKSVRTTENGERCMYRCQELSCVLGCFMSDAEYTPGMEGNTWDELVDIGVVPDCHFDLMTALQMLHDMNHPNKWEECFKEIANRFNLVYNCLTINNTSQ